MHCTVHKAEPVELCMTNQTPHTPLPIAGAIPHTSAVQSTVVLDQVVVAH